MQRGTLYSSPRNRSVELGELGERRSRRAGQVRTRKNRVVLRKEVADRYAMANRKNRVVPPAPVGALRSRGATERGRSRGSGTLLSSKAGRCPQRKGDRAGVRV